MKADFHPANQRGYANFDWLETHYSFSFATYFNPAREQFGCLRVLNDDTIAGGTGFDLHPHNNMEIITIMLEGALEHRDSMGNTQVITLGEVQVMSAGTGIFHAEYNHSETETAKLFQLWIFPREKNLKPRYDQLQFENLHDKNKLIPLVTPDNKQQEGTLWIHQDAFVSMLNLEEDTPFEYVIKIPGNGVFIFVIEGSISAQEYTLEKRDAFAFHDTDSVQLQSKGNTTLLFIEVPMK